MTLLRVLVLGLLSITTNTLIASEFKCPTPSQFPNVACENSITVRSLTELISYKSNLGIVNGKARNLIIDFDINTNDLVLATPCKITIAEKRSENLSGDLCLHGDLGVELLGYNNLSAMDVRLESKQAVKTNEYSNLNILDLEMISLGDNSLSKVSIGHGSKIDASNLVLESFDTASIASYVDIKASLGVSLSSEGFGNASIAEDTNISAKTFDQSTKLLASLTQDDSISAEVVTISGSSCSVFSGTTINANEKLGTCFLYSYPNKLFTASANNGFKPLTIYFDASKISSSKFIWSFGDGVTQTTSSSKTSHTYDQAGTFSATLKYLSDGQYKNAGTIQIYVKDSSPRPPVASIACTPNNMLVNCNALGSYDPQGQPLIYSFTYSDGFFEENNTGLSSHAFSIPGLYQVSVSVSNLFGLSAIASTQVQAMLPPNVLPKVMLNCSSSKPFYIECDSIGSTDSDGQIVSFQYSFDDGSVVTKSDTSKIAHTFSTGGNHQVQFVAIDNDGGVSSLSKTFSVLNNSNPIADFSCTSDKPYQISCLSNSSDPDAPNDFITEYSWIVNNQTITSSQGSSLDFNFFAGGDFPVTLIVKDSLGGSASVTKTIAVKPNLAPVASFTCSNTSVRSVHCASTSTDSDGSIASSSWVLDDGSNFSGTSFDYTFADDNSHSVTLIVADDLGTSASVSQTVTPIKNQAPTGDILASTLSGSAPLSVNFTAQNALDSDGSIASIAWSFSDGATATGQSVTHIFNSIGSFTATMTITDNLGASVTKSVSISALEPLKEAPLAFFKLYQIGTLAELHSYVSKTQFDIKKAYYTIDGGQVVNLTEYYPDTIKVVDMLTYGKHKVDLTVEDVRGQVKTYSLSYTQIHNLASLAAYNDFSVSQSAVRTVFVDLSKIYNFDLDQTIKNYRVEYGDGTYEDTTNLFTSHIYASAGTYQVKVTATTSALYSVSNTVSKTVTVTNSDVAISNPIAGFTYRIYDFAQNVSFYNDRSVTPNGSIISYAWDFGDGSTGTGQKVAHFYTPGSYLVTLTVTDTAGLRSSETQHITISNPGVDLEASVDCNIAYPYVEYIQTCKVVTLDRLGQLSRIRITWGDGGVSNLALNSTQGVNKPTHTYVNPSNYPVMVTAFTTRGETKNVATNLNLGHYSSNFLPIASLSCSADLLNMTCSAQGSRDPQNQELTYIIDWGDGQRDVSPSTSIVHTYLLSGSYSVTLSVLNSTELVSSVIKTYAVLDHNIFPTLNCMTNNLLVSCNALGTYDSSGSTLTYTFDYGDNFKETNSSGVSNHAYDRSRAGLNTVTLKVQNTKGETASISTQVMPVIPPNQLPIARFNCNSPSPYVVYCTDAGSLDSDGSIINSKLTFDDNTEDFLSGNLSTRHQLAIGGDHTITLTVTDNDGGVSSSSQIVNVKSNSNPIASFTCSTPGPQRLSCYSTSTDPDSGDMIGTLDWDYGDGTTASGLASAFNHSYSVSGTYSVKLTVHDQYGGENSVVQEFTTLENQSPVANINCTKTAGLSYHCESNASDPDGYVVLASWNIEGNTYPGLAANIQFQSAGDKIINLTLTDDLGKTVTVTKTINIEYILPVASFDCVVEEGGAVTCTSSSTSQNGNITNVKWDLDTGASYQGDVLNYTFPNQTSHVITLTATDEVGFSSSVSKTIDLSALTPTFQMSFQNLNLDIPKQVKFSVSNLVDSGDGTVTYLWDLGDGATSTDSEVTHIYSKEDTYIVKLTVTNSKGTQGSASLIVPVMHESNVQIILDVASGVAPLTVHFDGTSSSDSKGNLIKYEWVYQGEVLSTLPAFDWTFDDVGDHDVVLRLTNEAGDITSQSKIIKTTAPPIYLDGAIPKKVFAGREYNAYFNLSTIATIPAENVQITLDPPPAGAVFDKNTMTLSWVPNNSQVGYHEFKIQLSDGIVSSYRIVRINVLEPHVIGSGSVAATGGSYTIDQPNSILNGTELTLPSADSGYDFNIVTSDDQDGTNVMLESSSDLSSPIKLDYQAPRDVIENMVNTDESFGRRSSHNSKSILSTHDLDEKCVDSVYTLINKTTYIKGDKIDNVQFWFENNNKSIRYDKIQLIKSILSNAVKKSPNALNIYFNTTYVDTKSYAFVPDFQQSNIYFDLLGFISNQDVNFYKFVLTHEYFHIIQNRLAGCGKQYKKYIFQHMKTKKNIKESTANYFGISQVEDEVSRRNIQNILTKLFIQNVDSGIETLVNGLFENLFLNGALDVTFDNPDRAYQSSIFFDKTSFKEGDLSTTDIQYNYEEFYKFWIKNFLEYKDLSDEEGTRQILTEYGTSISPRVDVKNILLGVARDTLDNHSFRITDENELSSKKFFGTYFLKYLKDENVYPWKSYNYGNYEALKNESRLQKNILKINLSGFGAGMKIIQYGKTGLYSYSMPYRVKFEMKDDLAIELYTSDIFGLDMAFYNTFISKKNEISYKNIVVNPNPFDVGPMATLDQSKPELLWDSLVDSSDLVKRYNGSTYIYAANSSLKNLEAEISITPLCKSYSRTNLTQPVILKCSDRNSNKELNCWDDLEMVVYFCPENSTDLTLNCLQSKGFGFSGNYLTNSRIYFTLHNVDGFPTVFACQQKKNNDLDELDFELSE